SGWSSWPPSGSAARSLQVRGDESGDGIDSRRPHQVIVIAAYPRRGKRADRRRTPLFDRPGRLWLAGRLDREYGPCERQGGVSGGGSQGVADELDEVVDRVRG